MSDRKSYRVRQRRRSLSVTLHAAGAPAATGQVEDLSAKGAGASFARQGTPWLPEDAEVGLSFESLVLLEPVRVRAIVRRRVREEDHCTYGFEFLDPAAVMQQVPYILLKEFNRRSAPRVEVEAHSAVEVSVAPHEGKGSLNGTLANISISGFGLRVARRDTEPIAAWERVRLAFTLPGRSTKTILGGFVRDRHEAGVETILGVEFDPESEGYESHIEAVEAFVSQRLKEALRTQKR